MKQLTLLTLSAMFTATTIAIVYIFLMNVPAGGVIDFNFEAFGIFIKISIDKDGIQTFEQKQEIQTLKGGNYLRN